ncbi:hypothetical protein PF004_g31759 [Phytophthora fragariae]|uniref:Uncharacterized protein n=1 Tax=Phytophthora fragariae TaxID=53985 RepID=A0A6G0M8T9_9STRA|nr:hypothetical protein PF003_g40643 [Phytophthora fragariae]KAE8875234.1 hypothetical protein PF003_g40642 [Phytophthora fragariae]KAE8875235.1 hypothetical protein PF003_g40645 [Phytophthora fragariae]KAE9158805.1 hypothetical protein PF004_g31759 [Phytophthora fragariae]
MITTLVEKLIGTTDKLVEVVQSLCGWSRLLSGLYAGGYSWFMLKALWGHVRHYGQVDGGGAVAECVRSAIERSGSIASG